MRYSIDKLANENKLVTRKGDSNEKFEFIPKRESSKSVYYIGSHSAKGLMLN